MALILTPGQLTQRADFYYELKSLVSAGIPVIDALQNVRSSSKAYRAEVEKAIQLLQSGNTLTEALSRIPGWLPTFDLALISAGEQSGRLDASLGQLSSYYKDRASLARQTISAMLYPVFILHLAVLIFPPSMITALVWQGAVAPFVKQKLFILLPIYTIVIVALLSMQGTRGKGWLALMERILNSIPLLGTARKNLALARFSAAMEALISAGVPVTDSWILAGKASGSAALEKAGVWAKPQIEAGVTPSEIVQRLRVFPDVFKSLYTSGEMSGQLDSTLQRLHQYYHEQATLRFQNLSEWTPRILFLIIAIAVGYHIISFYVDYFGQIGNAGF